MRRLEAGLVIAVATLTVMTTASVLTGGTPYAQRVDGVIQDGWHTMVRWLEAEPADGTSLSEAAGKSGPPARGETPVGGTAPEVSNTTGQDTLLPGLAGLWREEGGGLAEGAIGQAANSEADANGAGLGGQTGLGTLSGDSAAATTTWTAADLARLREIVTRAASEMQPADWQRLAGDLLSGDSAKAQADFSAWAGEHLSSEELAWIASRFSGARAFDGEDIQLLQQAIADLWSELTPQEQALAVSKLNGWVTAPSDGAVKESGPVRPN
ncbi:hypothetical protein [Alicyclobacillus sp.]|uniref:hypothetical protein n=1 Tax=Alicyclobacillus sp. TaxID=61169 RepID=UPI0025BC13C9|nr:hypothetical protein [Alicyclobacillus sp.]MCL6516582.1 hypothetical protein [Alicyclobacillus sp.]